MFVQVKWTGRVNLRLTELQERAVCDVASSALWELPLIVHSPHQAEGKLCNVPRMFLKALHSSTRQGLLPQCHGGGGLVTHCHMHRPVSWPCSWWAAVYHVPWTSPALELAGYCPPEEGSRHIGTTHAPSCAVSCIGSGSLFSSPPLGLLVHQPDLYSQWGPGIGELKDWSVCDKQEVMLITCSRKRHIAKVQLVNIKVVSVCVHVCLCVYLFAVRESN